MGYVRFLTGQCRDWLKNVVNLFIFRSKAPVWSSRRGMIQLLTQEYEGRDNDITIMPWSGHISPLNAICSAIKVCVYDVFIFCVCVFRALSLISCILQNPTPAEFFDVLRAAEKNTWPAIARIRAHCLIETTLDQCVQKLRKRISDESESHRHGSSKSGKIVIKMW